MQKQPIEQKIVQIVQKQSSQLKKELPSKTIEQENLTLQKLQCEIKSLTEQIRVQFSNENQNEIQVNGKIKLLIKLQMKFHSIKQLYLEAAENQGQKTQVNSIQINEEKQLAQKIQIIQMEAQNYEPGMEQINEKRQGMQEEMNDDGWTDATQSETGTLGPDGIMVLDDDMLEEFLGKIDDKASSSQEQQQPEVIDYEQLQTQFITGLQSNEDLLFGQHNHKFCVSVCSLLKQSIVISGGGDDKLHFYRVAQNKTNEQQVNQKKQTQKQPQKQEQVPQLVEVKTDSSTKQTPQTKNQEQITQKQQKQKPKFVSQTPLIEPFKTINHNQTIDIIDISHDKQHLFSLTQKELFCTNMKTFETIKVEIDPPSQLTCHKQGGVFAVANAFNVEIWNIKGFKFYDSFCLDEEVNILKWTLNGKQLVAACDNKLRIITPKNREVTKVAGTAFHDGQITAISMLQNTVFTGCIDGLVYASSLSKGQILGGIPPLQATINTLCAAQNYLIVGPAQNLIYWYDSNKLKQIFTNELKGSSTDIIQLATKNQYAVADIQGQIRLFDRRNPIQEKFLLKAGNSVHKLWYEDNTLLAACEDGFVRGWDLRKCAF